MATKKETKKKRGGVVKELLTPEDLENVGKIQSTLGLETIQLKRLKWQCKIWVKTTLPKTYRSYRIELSLDEDPYIKRIDDLETDFSNSLFASDKASLKSHNQKIQEIRTKLDQLRADTEKIEFVSLVEELKYKDAETVLLITLPDDVIEAFNRQKSRFDLYKIVLIPR